jgi:hypothetical protein
MLLSRGWRRDCRTIAERLQNDCRCRVDRIWMLSSQHGGTAALVTGVVQRLPRHKEAKKQPKTTDPSRQFLIQSVLLGEPQLDLGGNR